MLNNGHTCCRVVSNASPGDGRRDGVWRRARRGWGPRGLRLLTYFTRTPRGVRASRDSPSGVPASDCTPVSAIGPVGSKHCETNIALEKTEKGEVKAYKMQATDPSTLKGVLQVAPNFMKVHPLAVTYVPYLADL